MRGSTSLTVLGIAALVVLGLYIGLNSEGLFSAVYSDYFHFDLAKGSGTLTAGATGGTCYNSNGLWGQDAQLRSYWQDFYDYSLPTRPDMININPSDYYYDASSTIGLDVGGCFVKATNVVIEKSADAKYRVTVFVPPLGSQPQFQSGSCLTKVQQGQGACVSGSAIFRTNTPVETCGNGVCAASESCSACPSDCGQCPGPPPEPNIWADINSWFAGLMASIKTWLCAYLGTGCI